MSEPVALRPFASGDRAQLVALWTETGLLHPTNDPNADIDIAVGRAHARLLVADAGRAIVGSVLMGEDGHRAWVYYLAVAPSHRGQGLGRRLMTEAEDWARARGIPKLNLMVRTSNLGASDFYTGIDYVVSDTQTFQKVLRPLSRKPD